MRRLALVAANRAEEASLQKFIEADPQRKATYGAVLEQTARIYSGMTAQARQELVLDNMPAMSLPLRSAVTENVPILITSSRRMTETLADCPATTTARTETGIMPV